MGMLLRLPASGVLGEHNSSQTHARNRQYFARWMPRLAEMLLQVSSEHLACVQLPSSDILERRLGCSRSAIKKFVGRFCLVERWPGTDMPHLARKIRAVNRANEVPAVLDMRVQMGNSDVADVLTQQLMIIMEAPRVLLGMPFEQANDLAKRPTLKNAMAGFDSLKQRLGEKHQAWLWPLSETTLPQLPKVLADGAEKLPDMYRLNAPAVAA